MTQPHPTEPSRTLQRLGTELARLAGSSASDAQLLDSALRQVAQVSGCGAAALWLLADRSGSEFQFRLGASLREEEFLGAAESEQRDQVLRAAAEAVLSGQPLVQMPTPPHQRIQTPGTLVNLASVPVITVPVRGADEPMGVVQLWFSGTEAPKQLADLAVALQPVLADFAARLRSRQLRLLGAQSQRQQRLLQMAQDLIGLLDSKDCARLAATHVRDILGINRASLVARRGDRWVLLGISGQQAIQHSAEQAKHIVDLVGREARETLWVMSQSGTVDTSDSTLPLDGVMKSAALVPARSGPAGPMIACLVCESATADVFGPPGEAGNPVAPALALAQWLAELAGKSLSAALAHESAPFVKTLVRAGALRQRLTHSRRRRWLMWAALVIVPLSIAGIWPTTVKVEGGCTLLPTRRALVTAESPARIERLLVREGDRVAQGQVVAELDTRRLRLELESAAQTRQRLEAEAQRQRGQGKEALARIAALEALAAEEMERRLKLEIDLARLKAPIAGVVMTKDIHLRSGQFLQTGEALLEIADVVAWDLRVDVAEAELNLVEEALAARSPREVQFLLYVQSARPLTALLTSAEQISPALQSASDGAKFSFNLYQIDISPDLQPLMRPGLTGRAKIELGRQPAATVLMRQFIRWLRMRWWL